MNQTITKPSSLAIELDRDLIIDNEQSLLDDFLAIMQENPSEVTLNLSQVENVDAHGLALLAMFQRTLAKNGCQLTLQAEDSEFLALLQTTGITR